MKSYNLSVILRWLLCGSRKKHFFLTYSGCWFFLRILLKNGWFYLSYEELKKHKFLFVHTGPRTLQCALYCVCERIALLLWLSMVLWSTTHKAERRHVFDFNNNAVCIVSVVVVIYSVYVHYARSRPTARHAIIFYSRNQRSQLYTFLICYGFSALHTINALGRDMCALYTQRRRNNYMFTMRS